MAHGKGDSLFNVDYAIFQEEIIANISKIHRQHSKIFFSRITSVICFQTNLAQNILG